MTQIAETCSCGATFTIDASNNVVMTAVAEWRTSHRHEPVGA